MAETFIPADVAKFLGVDLEKVTDLKGFKEAFNGTFITIATAHEDEGIIKKATGKRMGVLDVKLRAVAKVAGFNLNEKKGESLEDILDFAFEQVGTKITGLTTDLDDAKKNAGNDDSEEVIRLTGELATMKKTSGEFQDAATEAVDALATHKKDASTKEITGRKQSFWDSGLAKVEFSDDATALTKKGFKADLKEKYTVQLDDDSNPFLADKEGNRIKDPDTAGSFLTIDQAFEKEAGDEKILKLQNTKEKKEKEEKNLKPVDGSEERKPRTSPLMR